MPIVDLSTEPAPELINMDMALSVYIDTHEAPWHRIAGRRVWRKYLERENPESGRCTSIVRFEPGAHFPHHGHPNGEEILVLSGIFEDERGRYPAGTYLRNPPNSNHQPFSQVGCELFVKLNAFADDDIQSINIDTSAQRWSSTSTAGICSMLLHHHKNEKTFLVRCEPDSELESEIQENGFELFLIDGIFYDELGTFPQGSWVRRQKPFRKRQQHSETGAVFLYKSGHL